MLPWCIHFVWQRKKREKERNFKVKIQQAAANNIISSSTCFFVGWFFKMLFFFKEPADKKKNRGKKMEKQLATVVPGIRITSMTLWTNTNKLEAGPAANKRPRQRGTDASFTCVLLRCSRDVRRPRYLPSANTAAVFHMGIVQMGPRKKQMSHFGDFQTGEVY